MHLSKKPTLHRNHRRSITESRFPSVPVSEMFFLFLFSSLLCYLSSCVLAPNCIFAKKAPSSHSPPLRQIKCSPVPPVFSEICFAISQSHIVLSYLALHPSVLFRAFLLYSNTKCHATTFFLFRRHLTRYYGKEVLFSHSIGLGLSVFIHFPDCIYCSRIHIYHIYRNHSFQIHSLRSLIHSPVPGYRCLREVRFPR